MPKFKYKAITKDGLTVTNTVDSPNKQLLIQKLRDGELEPIDIVAVGRNIN